MRLRVFTGPRQGADYATLRRSAQPTEELGALQAGKHVLCEKPLANRVAEAMAAAGAALQAVGLVTMVGFSYRVPAIALARELVAQGRIGRLRHVRASYLQDWLVAPAFPLTWRLQAGNAGSGAGTRLPGLHQPRHAQ